MAERNGNPGIDGKAPALSRTCFLFGLSLLTIAALLDAQPAVAQYVGIGPFGIYLGGGGHYRGGYSHHRSHRHSYYHPRGRHAHRPMHRHGGGGGHRHHDGGGAPVPKI